MFFFNSLKKTFLISYSVKLFAILFVISVMHWYFVELFLHWTDWLLSFLHCNMVQQFVALSSLPELNDNKIQCDVPVRDVLGKKINVSQYESWLDLKTCSARNVLCAYVTRAHAWANFSVSYVLTQNTDWGKVKPVSTFPCHLLSIPWTSLSLCLFQSGLHYTVLRLPY